MTMDGLGAPADLAGVRPHHGAFRVGGREFEVRATRIRLDAGLAVRGELWMGGGYTTLGDPVADRDLAEAWVVDCAGELPPAFATASARYTPRVFEDIEQVPASYPHIQLLARAVAEALSAASGPDRVYVMCKQGLNRSGLVAGRVLRELGVSSDEVIATLQRHRPGALGNLAFQRLLIE